MDNYLDVTHVQQVLRNFAKDGHDILKNPKTAHIDEKPYGMAVGHKLYFSGDPSSGHHELESHVLQSEQPIISTIASRSNSQSTKPWIFRDVTPQVHHPDHGIYASPYSYSLHNTEGHYTEELHKESSKWVPNHNEDSVPYKDIHEALESHTKMTPTNMTSEQRGKFDEQAALKNMVNVKPFAGHVEVLHDLGRNDQGEKVYNKYTYNPETEQLIKHEGD